MASGSVLRQPGARPERLAGELGELLVAARGDVPRSELAKAAGVSANTLRDLELGRANPTLALLEALGPVYGLDLQLTAAAR